MSIISSDYRHCASNGKFFCVSCSRVQLNKCQYQSFQTDTRTHRPTLTTNINSDHENSFRFIYIYSHWDWIVFWWKQWTSISCSLYLTRLFAINASNSNNIKNQCSWRKFKVRIATTKKQHKCVNNLIHFHI